MELQKEQKNVMIIIQMIMKDVVQHALLKMVGLVMEFLAYVKNVAMELQKVPNNVMMIMKMIMMDVLQHVLLNLDGHVLDL